MVRRARTSGVGDPAVRQKSAREIFDITRDALFTAIKNAPEILFVAAAGNSDNNVTALLAQMQGIENRRAALVSTLVAVRFPQDPEPLIAMGRAAGVRSLGVVVVIGEIVVTLAAAFLLPLIWSATWRLQGRAPGQQPEFEMIPAEDATGTMDAPQAASHGADSEEP